MTPRGKFWTALAPFAIAASGCAGVQREVRISTSRLKSGSATAFSTPADLRLGFLRTSKEGEPIYCAEPMPDTSLGSDVSLSGSLANSQSASQSAAVAATLADTNQALLEDNESLRRELDRTKDQLVQGDESKSSVCTSIERARNRKSSTSASHNASETSSNQTSATSSLNATAAARFAATVSELSGRSPEVLLAREYLYRLCEARANGYLENREMAEGQLNALNLVKTVYQARFQVSEISNQTQLMKAINDFNSAQTKFCSDRKASCEDLAAQGTDEKDKTKAKAACVKPYDDCLSKITLRQPEKPKD